MDILVQNLRDKIKMNDRISIIAGRCTCKRKLDLRTMTPEISNIKNLWTIHGVCKKCNIVYLQALYDCEPKENIDYIVIRDKIVEV